MFSLSGHIITKRQKALKPTLVDMLVSLAFRESFEGNSEAVVKFKGQDVRAGVVNLTVKVKRNCGSLTPSTKQKLTATTRIAVAVADETIKMKNKCQSTTNVVRRASQIALTMTLIDSGNVNFINIISLIILSLINDVTKADDPNN